MRQESARFKLDLNVSRLIVYDIQNILPIGVETGHITVRRLSGTFPSHYYIGKPTSKVVPIRRRTQILARPVQNFSTG